MRLGLVVMVGGVWGRSPALAGADVILTPPAVEASGSPSGNHIIEIRLPDGADPHAARSTATLFSVAAGGARSLLWKLDLPHRPRPRFALVADNGIVVLLDEWLNVRSDWAVMVIDRDGRTVARHGLEAVRAALGVPIKALAPLARHGVWMQSLPALSTRGDVCEVQAGGRTLSIALRDGALSSH